MKKGYFWGWIFALVMWVVAIILVSMLSGCRSVKYVPVEKEHNTVIKDTVYVRDSVYRDNHSSQRDSIIRKDSIVFVVDESGNVLRKELYSQKEIYSNLEREYQALQEQYERLKSEKVDTVYKDIPIYIEKDLTPWEKFRMNFGFWAIIAVFICFVGRILIKRLL